MSPDTVEFLLELLNRVSVSAADPNLEQATAAIVKARRELEAQLPKPAGDAEPNRAQRRSAARRRTQ